MIGRLRQGGRPAILGSLASGVATQGLVLVTGILAARLLGPTDRGHLALIWTITLILAQFGSLGLPLAVTYEIAAGRATGLSLLRDLGPSVRRQIAIVTALHASAVVVLVTVTSTPAAAAYLSIVVVPAAFVQAFALAALQGGQRFREYNVLRLLAVAVYAGALAVLAAFGSPGLTVVTAAWVAGWLVAGIATFVLVRRAFRREAVRRDAGATASSEEMRRFGRRGLFGWVSPTETLRVDQLAVGLVLSAYDLGLYVAALAFTNLPRFLAQAVGTVAYPRVAAELDMATQRRTMWRYVSFGTALSATIAGLLAIGADPLVRLAFGDMFAGAVGPLRIVLLATVILCARRVLSDAMRGAGFVTATSRAEIVSWLSLVPTLPLLGTAYGLPGVGVALCIGYLLSLCTLLLALLYPGGTKGPIGRLRRRSTPSERLANYDDER